MSDVESPNTVSEAVELLRRSGYAADFELVDGALRVHSIEEISGVADTHFETEAVFAHKDGSFSPTGKVPRFYSELEARGIPADQAVFR